MFGRGVKGPGSPGSGLGLHVTRRLLAAHGATIEVGATVRGCLVVVEIPVPGVGAVVDSGLVRFGELPAGAAGWAGRRRPLRLTFRSRQARDRRPVLTVRS